MGSTSTNPYSTQSSVGYNASPPADDGSEVATNKIEWDAKIRAKLTDVLKTFIELVDTTLVTSFSKTINTDDAVKNVLSGSLGFESDELTIASGAVAPNRTHHTFDTESDAASDDLDNATTTNMAAESLLILSSANGARTVVIKHEATGAGEFHLTDNADYSLDDAEKIIVFQLHSSDGDWYEVSRSDAVSKVVQTAFTSTGAVADGSTVTVEDDTIPQNTEGHEFITLAITPKNANNKLLIEIGGNFASSIGSGAKTFIMALFQDTTADALAATIQEEVSSSAAVNVNINLRHEMTAGTTSSTTFKMRCGTTGSGTTTMNGSGGSRLLGGVIPSFMRITEFAA